RAPPRYRGRWRRHDWSNIAVWRPIEVDDYRGVIARQRAFAGLPIYPGGLHPVRHRLASQHQVDAHTEILVKHAGPIVPIGKYPLRRPMIPHDVMQADGLEAGERFSLWRRDVGLPDVSV